ncbi:hypothetical protein ABZX77_39380 [Streptomyces sp. NPDC004237]|uniref:hypothetical protein n=1 Tax=Streptomyces sp. NPDC004237 TaxID=3154455 RepID=UPI0033AE08D6
MMSGSEVPAWALAAGAAVTAAVGWCLTGRERGPLSIVVAVVAAQAVLHEGFSFARPAAVASVTAASIHMGSMRGDSTGMAPMDHMQHMDRMGHSLAGTSPSAGMLAVHLVAALLCGMWLAYGEKAAFRIMRAVAGWLTAPLRLLLTLPGAAYRPLGHPRRRDADRAPYLPLLVHAITSRGPPVRDAVV